MSAVSELREKYLAAVDGAGDESALEQVRLAALGKKGEVSALMRSLGAMSAEERQTAGPALNALKDDLNAALAAARDRLAAAALDARLAGEWADITLPTRPLARGTVHPVSQVMEEITAIFADLGFSVAEGPQVETDWYNFDALNIPAEHPARQDHDTFYMARAEGDNRPPHVLRTHTSPVQARVMLDQQPPIYVACPGKVFRSDELDQTHTPVFHQVEGLAVDKGLTMAHLKGVLDHFAKAMFGPEARARLRPSYFPFTEPSAEMDLWFPQKKGGAGWIEWGGCGMVNPNVLTACGIDPEVYTGFAFGMGLERTLMLRHGIADMHDIVEGDIRFSQQFGTTGKGN